MEGRQDHLGLSHARTCGAAVRCRCAGITLTPAAEQTCRTCPIDPPTSNGRLRRHGTNCSVRTLEVCSTPCARGGNCFADVSKQPCGAAAAESTTIARPAAQASCYSAAASTLEGYLPLKSVGPIGKDYSSVEYLGDSSLSGAARSVGRVLCRSARARRQALTTLRNCSCLLYTSPSPRD